MKHFFVPDLHFHRYEPLSHYESTRQFLEETCDRDGEDVAKRIVAATLISMFEAEAGEWGQKLEDMS